MTEKNRTYAELAIQANAENKIIYQHKNGEYELIDQITHNTCIFNGEKWVEDAEKLAEYKKMFVPQVLSRFQALTILKLTKIDETTSLYQATDAYINSLSGETAKEIVIKTAWETASEFRRDSTLINTCKEMFGLTDEQVDEMFIKGYALEV